MPTTIDQLQIEIETTSDGAVKGLGKVKSMLQNIDKLAHSSGLTTVYQKLKDISNLNFSNLDKLNKLGDTLKRLDAVEKKVNSLASSINNVPDSIGTTADIVGASDAISDIHQISDEINNIPERKDIDVDSSGATEVVKDFDAIADKMINTYNQADILNEKLAETKRKIASALAANDKGDSKPLASLIQQAQKLKQQINGLNDTPIKRIKKAMDDVSRSTQKATKRASGLAQMLKIVFVYGLMFRMFSVVMEGVSEGLQNVAQYNSETAAAMGQLSTMALTLKNSIGAALYPTLVALTPVLQTITNAVARACEAFSQLVSLLTGKTTYLKAKTYAKSYVETTKTAAQKAANEIRKSFAGLDEITVIGEKPTSASSASGGGGDNYSQMFEEVPIDNPKIQALVPFFQGLGEILGSCFKTIKEIANDYLYPWLVKIGKWLEEHPEAAKKIGEIAGKISVLVLAIKGLKWLGEVTGVTKLAKALWNLRSKTRGVTQAFGDKNKTLDAQTKKTGLETVKVLSLAAAFGAALYGVKKLKDWLKEHPLQLPEGWKFPVPDPIPQLAPAFAKAKEWLASNPLSVPPITLPAFSMMPVLVPAFEWAKTHIGEFTSSALGNLSQWLSDVTGLQLDLQPTISTGLETAKVTIKTFIADRITDVKQWISDTATQKLDFIPVIQTGIETATSKLTTFASERLTGVKQWIEDVKQLKLDFQPVIETAISNAVTNLSSFAENTKSTISQWATNVSTNVKNATSNIATNVYNALSSAGNNVVNFVNNSSQNFSKWCSNMASNMQKTAKNIADNFGSGLSKAWTNFKNFCKATGKALSNFWSENKATIITVGVAAGLTIAGIALAPYTGGASLGLAAFANGGFPTPGELFLANEQGAEFIGSMGGRPAVANNDQIVEGIQHGVYAANQEQNVLLREQNKLLRQIVDKETNGEVNVSTITKAIERKNRRDGRTVVPVGI